MDKLGGVIMDRRRLMMNDTIETLDGKPIITCKRSKGSKFADLKLFGKSEQFKTTGKNLFNISKTTDNGLVTSFIEITDTDYLTGTIKAIFSNAYQQLGVVINAENNTTYTLSFTQENSKKDEIEVRAYYFQDNTIGELINSIVTSSKDIVFTFSTSKESSIAVWFRPKGVYSQTETNTCVFTKIQLEKSPSATSYEPYTGGKPSPSPDYPQEIKSVVNPVVKISNGDGTESQTIQLPYTLNAVSVPSGGNYTDENGQQWIADYVDMAKGKLVRNILKWYLADISSFDNYRMYHFNTSKLGIDGSKIGLSNMFKIQNGKYNHTDSSLYVAVDGKSASLYMGDMTADEMKKWIAEKNPEVYSLMLTPQEISLTPDEITAYKVLHTYTGTTNISNDAEAWMQVGYRKVR